MIFIEKVDTNNAFPTIDFKFHNSGTVSAFLWRFDVIVSAVSVDPTPVIRVFGYIDNQVDDRPVEEIPGDLVIGAFNAGWGDLRDSRFTLTGAILDELVPESVRTSNANMPSGARRKIFRLRIEDVNRALLIDHLKRADKIQTLQYVRSQDGPSFGFYVTTQAVRLSTPDVQWTGIDEQSHGVSDTKRVGVRSGLYLCEHGFVLARYHPPSLCAVPSEVTYCTILDIDRELHTRSYKIARQILAGGVERFHIMVGATIKEFIG